MQNYTVKSLVFFAPWLPSSSPPRHPVFVKLLCSFQRYFRQIEIKAHTHTHTHFLYLYHFFVT